jgi:hypothetical protein
MENFFQPLLTNPCLDFVPSQDADAIRVGFGRPTARIATSFQSSSAPLTRRQKSATRTWILRAPAAQ